ncbi:MAG: hypothetical protein PHD32_05935 [Eubacteriales bacterium]|nr:hypothetical protein [Eubacteriales bacterium]
MKLYRSKKSQQLIQESYDALLASWDVTPQQQLVPTRYGHTHVLV